LAHPIRHTLRFGRCGARGGLYRLKLWLMPGRKLTKKAARAMAAQRKTYGAGPGRPRGSKDPRCPCGAMTLKCARLRYHHCS
jgi:hypothetical protein